MKIAIITTGDMEYKSLKEALKTLFPDHDFCNIQNKQNKPSKNKETFPFPSFTSTDVTKLTQNPEKKNILDKLIARAANAARGDTRKKIKPVDLVLIVDDLELANIHQAKTVTEAVRQAIQRHLSTLNYDTQLQEDTATILRERVSFHLAKPMIESWLFADPASLTTAGVPPKQPIHLQPGLDPEDFTTNDPDYDADTAEMCTCWHSLPTRKQKSHKPQWLTDNRQRHPKAYISWLCVDPTQKKCSTYSETKGGAKALAQLNWDKLFSHKDHAPFARALIEDIAWVLKEKDPYPGHTADETSHRKLPEKPLLRNL